MTGGYYNEDGPGGVSFNRNFTYKYEESELIQDYIPFRT